MDILQNRLLVRLKTGLFFLAMLVWSCSTPVSLEDEGLTLVNRTTNPLIYSIVELETFHQMDLMWKFHITSDQENILHPNKSITIFEEDITVLNKYKPVRDLAINLWEVIGDSAFIRAGITLMNEELEQWEFRAQIKEGEEGALVIDSARE